MRCSVEREIMRQRPSVTPLIPLALLLVLRVAVAGGISWPSMPNWIPTTEPVKATACVYIYEKDDSAIPPPVLAALDKLNREKKIIATTFEDDTLDGTGQVPDQYKVPLAAANEAGLPALVVTAGDTVLKVVKAPTTLEQVLEACP